jgi:hypothetical protein
MNAAFLNRPEFPFSAAITATSSGYPRARCAKNMTQIIPGCVEGGKKTPIAGAKKTPHPKRPGAFLGRKQKSSQINSKTEKNKNNQRVKQTLPKPKTSLPFFQIAPA